MVSTLKEQAGIQTQEKAEAEGVVLGTRQQKILALPW
jgi:hypothetical protein